MKPTFFLTIGCSIAITLSASLAYAETTDNFIIPGPSCYNGSKQTIRDSWRAWQKKIQECTQKNNKLYEKILATQSEIAKARKEGKKVSNKDVKQQIREARKQRKVCQKMRKEKVPSPREFTCEKTPGFRYAKLSPNGTECEDIQTALTACGEKYQGSLSKNLTECFHKIDYKFGLIYETCKATGLRESARTGGSLVPIWQDPSMEKTTKSAEGAEK